MHKKTIVFYLDSTRIKTFYELIKYCSKDFNIILLTTAKDKKNIKIEYLTIKTIYINKSIITIFMQKLRYFIGKKLHWSINQIIFSYLTKFQYLHEYHIVKKIDSQFGISCLLSQSDTGFISRVGALVYAKKHKIPIVIPYFYISDYYISSYKNPKYWEKSNLCWYQNYIFKKFSNDKYGVQKYKEHFFFPAFILASQNSFYKILSKNPYFVGCGINDIVIIDNIYTYRTYENKTDMDTSKLRILGNISDDEIFTTYKNRDEIKKEFIKRYNLDKNKKIIIYSVPCYFEHGMLKNHEDARAYIEKVILSIQMATNANILLALHPRITKDEYNYLDNKLNCTIPVEPLSNYVSIADTFVADFSSTVAWATLCKIPSVLISPTETLEFFNNFNTVFTSNNFKEFQTNIQFVMKNKIDFSHDWELLSRKLIFDGKTKQRYLNLIKSIVTN